MRRISLAGGLLALLLLTVSGCDSPTEKQREAQVGAPAPDFTLVNMDGEQVTLSALKGKVVLINFWATWCPPCRAEKPTMEEIYRTFKDDGLVVLAVNVEDNGHQVVSQYLRSHSYSFPVVLDPKAVAQGLYGVFRYPESFIVDRNGIVVEKIIGARDWMKNPTYRTIEKLLAN